MYCHLSHVLQIIGVMILTLFLYALHQIQLFFSYQEKRYGNATDELNCKLSNECTDQYRALPMLYQHDKQNSKGHERIRNSLKRNK